MISDQDLSALVAEKALAHLAWDDAHPEVGMGMFYDEAVRLAWGDVQTEAARWNSLEALSLDSARLTRIEPLAYQIVIKARESR